MKEAKEYAVLRALKAGLITSGEACKHLDCHRSTLWRRKKRVLESGPDGLAHRLRGQRSNRRGKDPLRREVLELYRSEYKAHGFGARHFWEEARTQFSAPTAYSTVWRWLRQAGLTERSRRPSKHRSRRPRKEAFGEMLQMDTSIHDWFGTGEKQYLVSIVDDATGKVLGSFFNDRDTVLANMRVLKECFELYGLPIAIYVDRSPIFKFTRTGIGRVRRPRYSGPVLTQVERALATLGVELIHAYTPQAKGRIERLFGTWQKRLIPELSKLGIKTYDDANMYLTQTFIPKFNERFAVDSATASTSFVPLLDVNLNTILAERYSRVVSNDHIVSCAPAKLKAKILPGRLRTSYAKTKVEVLRHIDGQCSIYHGTEPLNWKVFNP